MVMMIIWFCTALFEIKEKPVFSLATQMLWVVCLQSVKNHLWSLEWGSLPNEVTLLHSPWCHEMSTSTKTQQHIVEATFPTKVVMLVHFDEEKSLVLCLHFKGALDWSLNGELLWRSAWSQSICLLGAILTFHEFKQATLVQDSPSNSPPPHKARCSTLVNFILALMPGLLHIWTRCKNLKTIKIACIKLVAFWILPGLFMLISPSPFSRYYWRVQLFDWDIGKQNCQYRTITVADGFILRIVMVPSWVGNFLWTTAHCIAHH